eukprot:1157776-Pelagomonas_calceolata.AAC.3
MRAGCHGLLLVGNGTDFSSPCDTCGPSKASSSAAVMPLPLDEVDMHGGPEEVSYQQAISQPQHPDPTGASAPAGVAAAQGGKGNEGLAKSSGSKGMVAPAAAAAPALADKFAREGSGSGDSTHVETTERSVSSSQALPAEWKMGSNSKICPVRFSDRASVRGLSNTNNTNSGVLDVSMDLWGNGGIGSAAASSRVEGQWELDLGSSVPREQPTYLLGQEGEEERDKLSALPVGQPHLQGKRFQQQQQQQQQQQEEPQQAELQQPQKPQEEPQQEFLQRPPSPLAPKPGTTHHGLEEKQGCGRQRSRELCSGHSSGNDTRTDEGRDAMTPEYAPAGMCW